MVVLQKRSVLLQAPASEIMRRIIHGIVGRIRIEFHCLSLPDIFDIRIGICPYRPGLIVKDGCSAAAEAVIDCDRIEVVIDGIEGTVLLNLIGSGIPVKNELAIGLQAPADQNQGRICRGDLCTDKFHPSSFADSRMPDTLSVDIAALHAVIFIDIEMPAAQVDSNQVGSAPHGIERAVIFREIPADFIGYDIPVFFQAPAGQLHGGIVMSDAGGSEVHTVSASHLDDPLPEAAFILECISVPEAGCIISAVQIQGDRVGILPDCVKSTILLGHIAVGRR